MHSDPWFHICTAFFVAGVQALSVELETPLILAEGGMRLKEGGGAWTGGGGEGTGEDGREGEGARGAAQRGRGEGGGGVRGGGRGGKRHSPWAMYQRAMAERCVVACLHA